MIRPDYETLARELVATWEAPSDADCAKAARILASARQAVTPVTPLRPRTPVRRAA